MTNQNPEDRQQPNRQQRNHETNKSAAKGEENLSAYQAAVFAGLVECASDAIIIVDDAQRITVFNGGAESIFGYTAREAVGMPLQQLLPPRFHGLHQRHFESFGRATEVSRTMGERREIFGLRKDGSEFPAEASISRLNIGDRQVFTVMLRDISERKRTEAVLQQHAEGVRRSHAVLNGLVQLASDAIIFVDKSQRISLFNGGAERIFGYSAEEVLGTPLQRLLPPRFHESHQKHFNDFGRSGVVSRTMGERAEVYGLRKDGSEFSAEASISRLDVDDQQVFTVMLRDVSERKRTEAVFKDQADALRQSHAVLNGLVQLAGAAIILVDKTQCVTLFNGAAERTFGYTSEEMLGKPLQRLLPPRFHDSHWERFDEFGRSAEVSRTMAERSEVFGLRKDGSEFPAEASISRLDIGEHQVFTVILRDVSDRKRTEATLRDQAENLRRSNAILEQFAYVASHDLQEPLRTVSSYCDLLAKRYGDKLDEDAREFIGYAVDGANRMQVLIRDLLEYSKAGWQGGDDIPTDSGTIVEEACQNLKMAIEESGASVICDPLPTIACDPSQLIMLFQNLIGNGIKYRSERTPEIRISAQSKDGACTFVVADNGIGIAPEYAERVFRVFQRLHNRAEHPGTGIGLAICKNIVENHGGRIWVESTPGEGSSFKFTFPAMKGVTDVEIGNRTAN